jgi:hypothetical protein
MLLDGARDLFVLFLQDVSEVELVSPIGLPESYEVTETQPCLEEISLLPDSHRYADDDSNSLIVTSHLFRWSMNV